MGKFIDISGRRFGNLVVLSRDGNKETKPSTRQKDIGWKCKCDCGNILIVVGGRLRSFGVLHCKKCGKEKRLLKNQLNGKLPNTLIYNLKWGAKTRGIEFDTSITEEYLKEIYEKQNRMCAISGLPIVFAETNDLHRHGSSDGSSSASLDRIDSSKGYTKDNIQWTHKKVNAMKNNLNENEFLRLCKAVAENNIK